MAKQRGMLYSEALETSRLQFRSPPTQEELAEIEEMLLPKPIELYGLRFPEKDAKTERDWMRLSYVEEDEAFLAEQQRLTITEKE